MTDEKMAIKLFRFDPSVDSAPRYETYEVPWEEDMTGLMVLHYINENIEPIGYDYSCRTGLCGRCSCVIDGRAGLACYRMMTKGEHTFDPLPKFPIIRDLVVDHSYIMRKLIDSRLAVETVTPITKLGPIDYEVWEKNMRPLNMCRECMSCYAVCPPLQEENKWDSFIGPAAMAQIGLRFLDPYDQGDRVGQAAFSGVFDCTLCGECSKVCPALIHHVDVIGQLQKAAEEKGLKPTV